MTGWLIGALAALAGVIGAWLKGRSQGRADAKARQDADYRKTRERMDAVSTDGLDDAAVADRLRQHVKRPGGL